MELIAQQQLVNSTSGTIREAGQPLVSIIAFCKDRASTIRRSIDSVLNQTYLNIEFVVQDGASTDGTLEILKSYDDPRIRIVSEKDSGPAEAFWRVINRCRGEYIGTCLSDEELLPGAIEKAVGHFKADANVGAITCDGYLTDMEGKIVNEFNAGEFNLVDYLFGWYCPFWPGTFFRRQALIDVGLSSHRWTIECMEFEIWCRLGTQHVVKYIPERMSKYAVHETQLSNTKENFFEHFDNRARVIGAMFSKDGFFGDDEVKRNGCLYNQLYLLYNHVKAYKLEDQTKLLADRLRNLRDSIGLIDNMRYVEYFNFTENNLKKKFSHGQSRYAAFKVAHRLWVQIALKFSAEIRKKFPLRIKIALRKIFTSMIFIAYTAKQIPFAVRKNLATRNPENAIGDSPEEIYSPDFSPMLYHDAAQIYYARGQIDEALQMWRRAEAMNDLNIDGVAAQAMLMSPTSTYEDLSRIQKRWADRYATQDARLGNCAVIPYNGVRRIRVAYFCAWFESDVFKSILGQVIKNADREKFEIFGYSSSPVSNDIKQVFDTFKVTGNLSDKEFVRLIRADKIDICNEITGFSPFNRFSAMASRCAPIQVSYLNHTGTSAVPNVDYILADEVSVPPEHDRHFTEKVWRLPGCFLSYNYDAFQMPPIVPPPMLARGYVTFGCFGSGGKISTPLIELWAKVMHRVPGSRFLIRNNQLSTQDNRDFMASRFRRFGIDDSRLTILGGTDRQTILRCYDDIDISLDTWPYCGGNTVAESLWQGVPLVTLKSDRFSGRYGASLLIVAGCGELVANSHEEYVDLAATLAGSPDRLRNYRVSLRNLAQTHGLTDAVAFAAKLDAAYLAMMQRLHSK